MLKMLEHYCIRPEVGSVFISFMSALIVVLLTTAIYRLHFHPLARYPGPFIAKITDLYSIYHAWKGDRHLDFHRCHLKYGPIFRYGPSRLSCNTYTAHHSIYPSGANVRKSDFYHVLSPTTPNILTAIPDELHAKKRRVLSHAFSDKAIKSIEEHVLAQIRIFCQRIKESKQPMDMALWTGYLTGDILGELCFGKSWDMLSGETNRPVGKMITDLLKLALITGSTIPFWRLPLFSRLFFPRLQKSQHSFRTFAGSQSLVRIRLHYQQLSSSAPLPFKDFSHYLLSAPETLNTMSLISAVSFLTVAGVDTTATALSSILFYLTLSAHTPILHRLQAEIRILFPTIESVRSGPKLRSCNLLRAVVDESMRLTPPVPGLLPRTVLAGGMVIDGRSIPAGTEVGVCAYALHHNAAYFPNPNKFMPERWLSADEKEERETMEKAFVPFSAGPRACIGKSLAYLEVLVTVARVVWGFEFEAVGNVGEGMEGEYEVEDVLVCIKRGPWVRFWGREMQ